MDIKELFEKKYAMNAPSWSLERDPNGSYKYHATQSAFVLFEQQQIEIESLKVQLEKAQVVPEGFVLVPKAESTGLTDKNEKLIFVGDVVEFVGGCRDFLDLSGVRSPLYTVNKGDKMIVRKLKSGYTLSLPWIDCDTPSRIGNLGNYDFWNLHRDFVVIEAQEQSHDESI